MQNRSTEEVLVEIITKAISKIKNKRNEISKKRAAFIGYGLGYFITDILKSQKDSNFRGKWIDDVSWKSLNLIAPNHLNGSGKLWWDRQKITLFYLPKIFTAK